ncbi:MAG: hypothetical protein IPM54_15585 [Polyangiaceae bacterium]|nr:hypothetical protein [Polyangiaceae bacterium]
MANTEQLHPNEVFIRRVVAIFARKQEISFEEAVRQYRQIEAEYVALAGNDEAKALEVKQTITNHLLMDAEKEEQPHAICRELWEELVQRGFMSMNMRHVMSSTYAQCCQFNHEFDAGVAVLEPLIAELEMLLAQSAITPNHRAVCEQFLSMHRAKHEELKAGIRERLMPMDRKLTLHEIALTKRINAVHFRERKGELTFEEAVRQYRQIEAEFVARAGDDEETKRRITESILNSAYETEQPHEICRAIWEELIQRGFSNEERRQSMSRLYAWCCQTNGEVDAALAVIKPLIAELEQRLEDTTVARETRRSLETNLLNLRWLRDELEAGIRE